MRHSYFRHKKAVSILAPFLAAMALAIAAPIHAGEPCEDAEKCLSTLAQELRSRGWVGIELERAHESLAVTKVIAGSPAEAAGLRVGDVLTAINGIAYTEDNRAELKTIYDLMRPGRTITYRVRRGDREQPLELTLAELPEHVMALWVGRHMLEHHLPASSDGKGD